MCQSPDDRLLLTVNVWKVLYLRTSWRACLGTLARWHTRSKPWLTYQIHAQQSKTEWTNPHISDSANLPCLSVRGETLSCAWRRNLGHWQSTDSMLVADGLHKRQQWDMLSLTNCISHYMILVLLMSGCPRKVGHLNLYAFNAWLRTVLPLIMMSSMPGCFETMWCLESYSFMHGCIMWDTWSYFRNTEKRTEHISVDAKMLIVRRLWSPILMIFLPSPTLIMQSTPSSVQTEKRLNWQSCLFGADEEGGRTALN